MARSRREKDDGCAPHPLSPEASARFQEFAARLSGRMTPDEVRRAFEDWAAGLDPEAPVLEIREGFECSYRMWLAEGAPPFPEEASG